VAITVALLEERALDSDSSPEISVGCGVCVGSGVGCGVDVGRAVGVAVGVGGTASSAPDPQADSVIATRHMLNSAIE